MGLIEGLTALVPDAELRELGPDVVTGEDLGMGWSNGEIILGGAGSDLMVGEGGDDILDGDASCGPAPRLAAGRDPYAGPGY